MKTVSYGNERGALMKLEPGHNVTPGSAERATDFWIPRSFTGELRQARPSVDTRGFSLVEVLICAAIIGLLMVMFQHFLDVRKEATLIACAAEADAMKSLVEQTYEQTWPMTPNWHQVKFIAGKRWNDHYHYIPNNYDPNSGHGNDLDFCDEDNPAAQKHGYKHTVCFDIEYVIVCDHDHGELVKYVAAVDDLGVRAFPHERDGGRDLPFLRDLAWWRGKDPNYQKFVKN
jgi:prepilin-type N-terminal cleavage/methylation domain-containing protein